MSASTESDGKVPRMSKDGELLEQIHKRTKFRFPVTLDTTSDLEYVCGTK